MASATAAGLGVRHPRRAHDPVLHLLLDVRVPADRRLDLGDGRPARPRLPDRRHRRPHHADRRGAPARRRPLAAAGRDQPGGRPLRPGVRLRGQPHHAVRPEPDVRRDRGAPARRGRHLLPHRLQRAGRAAARSRRTSTSTASSRASTRSSPRADGDGPQVQLLASGVGFPWIDERSGCWPRSGASRADVWSVTSWNELARDADRRRGVEPPAPGREPADAVRHRPARRRRPARSSRCRTTCAPYPSRSRAGSPATTACSAPTASASPTPGPPPAGSSRSTPSRWSCRPCRRSPTPARSTAARSRRRSPSYRIDDPTAVADVKQEGGDA